MINHPVFLKLKSNKRGIYIILCLIIILLPCALVAYRLWTPALESASARWLYISSDLSQGRAIEQTFSQSGLEAKSGAMLILNMVEPQTGYMAGAYQIEPHTTLWELLKRITRGRQTPINLTFNNIRTKQALAKRIAAQLEMDSLSIITLLNDSLYCQEKGYTTETIISLFIPNSYQFYWTISPKEWVNKMEREYHKFWNEKRLLQAQKQGITPTQVSIIASIVEQESNKAADLPIIAGLYLHRLRIGMPLQSCPTIRYALDDYTITRVLKKHLKVESPYNTYLYSGLPPGPIQIPSIQAIDAVLNAQDQGYIYMCAKEDFSGYHYFSKTLSEHNRYAARYQKAYERLEKMKQQQ